jgi:predicted O-methyltransferase YrrM
MNLKEFEKNIKSQYGEDGVIAEIFARIGTENKICVEFGAWDGVHLSNSWNLWHNQDWSAYLIEGVPEKVKVLEQTIAAFPKAHAIEAFVMPQGKNSLDDILSRHNVPKTFDLLSIDIDGDDYYIFQHLDHFRPRAVIIEFNATVPPYMEMVQERGEYMGASALSLIKLGEMKGYKPIHITPINVFFVSNEVFDLGFFEILDLDKSFPRLHLVNVITSYNGFPFLTDDLKYRFGVPLLDEPDVEPSFMALLRAIFKSKPKEMTRIPKANSSNSLLPVKIFKKK